MACSLHYFKLRLNENGKTNFVPWLTDMEMMVFAVPQVNDGSRLQDVIGEWGQKNLLNVYK